MASPEYTGIALISAGRARCAIGSEVAETSAMCFAAVVDRVRADFEATPDLELTLPQAVRVWTLGVDDCRYVLDALVDAGFLSWTARRTVMRRGRDLRPGADHQPAHILVRQRARANKSVRSE
jgi:hypothetical protein